MTLGAVLFIIIVLSGHAMWIDLLYYLSYIKLIISFIKYLPQVDFLLSGLVYLNTPTTHMVFSFGSTTAANQLWAGAFIIFYW